MKKKHQQRYMEQNSGKLKKLKVERRHCQQNSEIIAEQSTSSNMNIIESNIKKTTDANSQSLSGLGGLQTSSIQENERYIFH